MYGLESVNVRAIYLVRAVKSEKTGAYSFKEEMVPIDQVKDTLAKR